MKEDHLAIIRDALDQELVNLSPPLRRAFILEHSVKFEIASLCRDAWRAKRLRRGERRSPFGKELVMEEVRRDQCSHSPKIFDLGTQIRLDRHRRVNENASALQANDSHTRSDKSKLIGELFWRDPKIRS